MESYVGAQSDACMELARTPVMRARSRQGGFAAALPAIAALASGLWATGAVAADDPALDTKAQRDAPSAFAAKKPVPVLNWGAGNGRSIVIPAVEVGAFELLLNRFDYYTTDKVIYASPIDNFRENLHHKWIVDSDAFATNQFLHPYQGAIYQGFARSAGLGFWESAAYTMTGSLAWELAGESTRPSINDQVASGVGGLFLGEPLFRIASLLLETSPGGHPGRWREWGAATISPSTGINRLVFGERFDGVFRSNNPAVFTRIDIGASLTPHYSTNVNVNPDAAGPPIAQTLKRREASIDFTMAYGLPGKPDYGYTRPFDYFHFEFVASTANKFETVFSRGMLHGTTYGTGPNFRGIWGVYGTYAYVAPQIFRVSSTAVGVGTTVQWWLSRTIALQGTGIGGVGYGGGGVIHGAGVAGAGSGGDGQRDYHYGITPQGMLATRLIFSDRASLDTSLRDFYVSRVGATESTGSENIVRADFSLTVRIHNLHGITLRYAESRRDGRYANLPTSHQTISTVSIAYTLLGQTHFGAVDWRPSVARGP